MLLKNDDLACDLIKIYIFHINAREFPSAHTFFMLFFVQKLIVNAIGGSPPRQDNPKYVLNIFSS